MINSIDTDDIRRLDLNLLPVFLVLMEARSTTRAAEKLGLGQPAVSAALGRLRESFRDPLFVRVPRGLEPTPRALQLSATLAPALATIHASLRAPAPFDPRTAEMTIRLGMPDNHEQFLAPELLARLQQTAPQMRLVIRQVSGGEAPEALDSGVIDLACGRIDRVGAWQHRQVLMPISYLCLYDNRRLDVSGPLTLAEYLSVPHLLESARGDLEGVVDTALAALGKQRRVIYATPHFSALPAVLKRVRAVATLPEHAARRFAREHGLATSPPPVALKPYHSAIAWLSKHDDDPAHRWLRELIVSVVGELRQIKGQPAHRSAKAAPRLSGRKS